MTGEAVESQKSTVYRLLNALTSVDCEALQKLTTETIELAIPGARDLDITLRASGHEALCEWSKTVHDKCGTMSFAFQRYFEDGCEMMAIGSLNIKRIPRVFQSECAIHVRFDRGLISSFKLLFDTYALETFRGQMD